MALAGCGRLCGRKGTRGNGPAAHWRRQVTERRGGGSGRLQWGPGRAAEGLGGKRLVFRSRGLLLLLEGKRICLAEGEKVEDMWPVGDTESLLYGSGMQE